MMNTAATIFTSTDTSSGLTEEQERIFIDGYCDAAPSDYDADTDCEVSPQPWCCPWFAMSRERWQAELLEKLQQADGDLREAARAFAREDYAQLSEILAEEAAERASEEEEEEDDE